MRALLPAVPILLTLMVSGCTIPGIPCIPGLTCGQTVEETHDVIVIESLQALPSNVPPGGTIKLIAVISNVADIDAEIKDVPVYVELYDYCSGLFIKPADAQRKIENLLRGEKRQIEWTLQSLPREQVPVKTECTLKIRAKYQYSTKSITTLHLIDYAEMQRRISEGTYKEIGSYTSVGYGPIKPYITVEGTQPIPVENNNINTVLSLQIKNKGNGFLSGPFCQDGKSYCGGCSTDTQNKEDPGPIITRDQVKITSAGDSISGSIAQKLSTALNDFFKETCGSSTKYIKLIKKESTPMPCTIAGMDIGNVPVESTKTIQAEIENYWYEFRKEIKVTVEPKF